MGDELLNLWCKRIKQPDRRVRQLTFASRSQESQSVRKLGSLRRRCLARGGSLPSRQLHQSDCMGPMFGPHLKPMQLLPILHPFGPVKIRRKQKPFPQELAHFGFAQRSQVNVATSNMKFAPHEQTGVWLRATLIWLAAGSCISRKAACAGFPN